MWFQRQLVTRSHFIISREIERETLCEPTVFQKHINNKTKTSIQYKTKLQSNPPHLIVNHLNVNHDFKPSVIDSYFMTLELSTFLNPFEIYSTQCSMFMYKIGRTHCFNSKYLLLTFINSFHNPTSD